MSKIYKDRLVPIPENAYVNKCDARVYLVREKVYLPDMQYNSDKRKVVGRAVSEKEMYPNSTFRLLFPEIFQKCVEKEQMPKEQAPLPTKVIGPYAAFRAMGKNTGLHELLVKSFGSHYANAVMDYAVYSLLSQSGTSEDFRASRARYLLFSDTVYDGSWLADFLGDRLPDHQASRFRDDWTRQCRKQGIQEAWICVGGRNDSCDAEGDFLGEEEKSDFEKPLVQLMEPEDSFAERGMTDSQEAYGQLWELEDSAEKGGKADPNGTGGSIGCMWAVGADDGIPVTYRMCHGSQRDVGTLKELIVDLEENGIAVRGVILDSGHCNADSLRLLAGEGIPYVARLREDADAHRELLGRYGRELRLCNVYYLIQKSGVYGVSAKQRLFPGDSEEAYVSLYYDSKRGAERVNRLTEKVKAAMEQALAASADGETEVSADCRKYVHVIRDRHGTTVGMNQAALQEDIDREGFSSIASSQAMTADEKEAVYRLRLPSGEQFAILKSQMAEVAQESHLTCPEDSCAGESYGGMAQYGQLHLAYSEDGCESECTAAFIAGILRTEFENVCRKLGADVDEMLKELCQLHITMLPGKGYRMMHMESGRQLALLEELGVWMSDLDDIAVQENRRGNGVPST